MDASGYGKAMGCVLWFYGGAGFVVGLSAGFVLGKVL